MSVAQRRDVPTGTASWVAIAALLAGCGVTAEDDSTNPTCTGKCDVGSESQPRAQMLDHLLAQMNAQATLFGQERFNVTGVNGDGTQWLATAESLDRSDVKSVAGDHPVVMGFDAWDLAIKPESWTPGGSVHAAAARHVHASGGVVELAFHMHGCREAGFNGEGNYDCLCAAANDDEFARTWLLAEYAKVADAIVAQGLDRFPVIFRPLHEHDGDWFWWGAKYWNCGGAVTGEDAYKRVFRTVVTYLRDQRGLDNLLFAYSPSGQTSDYLRGYPGDEYVDILGTDIYYSSSNFAEETARYRGLLQAITQLARERGKVAALTEVGNNLLATEQQPTWYTTQLLPLLQSDGVDLAYAMTWENRTNGMAQFWVPYPGHPGVDDFQAFAQSSSVALLGDAPDFTRPADGYPTCRSCGSDPDGDRWGWENDESCRVASWCLEPQYPACASCSSDGDGDGWGWENERSCRIFAWCAR